MSVTAHFLTDSVLGEVGRERLAQMAKHGDQSHLPDGTGADLIWVRMPAYQLAMRADRFAEWARIRTKAASQNEGGDGSITYEMILTEEFGEAICESDPAHLRAELIQVAAVAVAWIESIDRRELEALSPGLVDRIQHIHARREIGVRS